MIGYKDRTWCGQDACQNECGRQFTPEERQRAIHWWGADDFPIIMAEFCDEKGKLKEHAYVN